MTAIARAARLSDADVLDAMELAQLTEVWAQERAGAGRALVESYDADAGKVVETWDSLTAWSPSTNNLVSGGKVYGKATNDPAGGALAKAIPMGTSFRFTAAIDLVEGSGSLLHGIGLSTADPPAVLGLANSTIWGFRASKAMRYQGGAGHTFLNWTGGSGGDNVFLNSSTWTVTITGDANRISITIRNAAGTIEYSDVRSWTVSYASIVFWNADSRELAGTAIRPLGFEFTNNTFPASTGIEGHADGALQSTQTDGSNFRVWMPKTYDSRIPAPLCIFSHGSTTGGAEWAWSNVPMRGVLVALLNAGYIVAATQAGPGALGDDNWGRQAAIDDEVELYEWVVARYNVGSVVRVAASMGGLVSLLGLAERRIPTVAWVGIMPVTNLANMYAISSRKATIRAAYGFTLDAQYVAATEGHDPMLLTSNAFRGIPMRFYASPADTDVSKAANSDLFAAKVSRWAPEAEVVVCSGPHGDASQFQGSDVVTFLDTYARTA